MADISFSKGGTLNVSAIASLVTIKGFAGHSGRQYYILNKGGSIVYIDWNAGNPVADTTDGAEKAYIVSGEAPLPIPPGAKIFKIACSAGQTAIVVFFSKQQ